MEDYVNPAKPLDSEDYWITAKCPKAMAALRCAFPQAEWDVLTTTIDAQISEDNKQNPAQWLDRQAITTLSWWGTNNSKHTQFSSQTETRARYVHSSMAHSRAFRIPEV